MISTKVDISHKTIVFAVFFLLFLYFLYQIKEIILLFFSSFLVMTAVRPLAYKLHKYKLPKILAIVVVYLAITFLLLGSLTILIPPLINETAKFMEILPSYTSQFLKIANINTDFFTTQITSVGGNILKLTVSAFSNFFTILTILVFSFYLLIERDHFSKYLEGFVGETLSQKIMKVLNKIEKRLGDWVRGEMILALTVGMLTFIGLTLLKVPYSLPLAILAGILEVIPTIGPIISAVPAVLLTFLISPLLSFFTMILYILIQQLENHLIVPKVMQNIVGFPPIITILALLIGSKILGFVGILLGVPLLLVFQVIIGELVNPDKE